MTVKPVKAVARKGGKSKKKGSKATRDAAIQMDTTPCATCGVKYCDDTTRRGWIMCQHPTCQKWYHNECQGLEENLPKDQMFFCISCEDSDAEQAK